MVPAPPAIPTRFPCWCRAVYSYGGDSNRDLGFVEGDLIECLNAGDGSWWMGRLRRDRRMAGLFPSNFVEVLPDNFRPGNLSSLSLPNQAAPLAAPAKSRTFRKPFESYSKAPHYTTAKQPETFREKYAMPSPISRRRDTSSIPTSATPRQTRNIYDDGGRKRTPVHGHYEVTRLRTPIHSHSSAAHSPKLSPAPSARSRCQTNHAQAPLDIQDESPPPPPPHRHIGSTWTHSTSLSYENKMPSHRTVGVSRHDSQLSCDARVPQDSSRHGSHASYESRLQLPELIHRHGSDASYDSRIQLDLGSRGSQASYNPTSGYEPYCLPNSHNPPMLGYHTPRAHSPVPSHAGSGLNMTPSPLREAMDGVMEQLDALGVSREPDPESEPEPESPEAPLDPWSRETFDPVSQKSQTGNRKEAVEPQTSLALMNADRTGSGNSSHKHPYPAIHGHEARPPELSAYVERMETRLRKMHARSSSMAIDTSDDEGPAPPPKPRGYEKSKSSMEVFIDEPSRKLPNKRSAYDVGKMLGRTFTTKTNSTSASSRTESSSATQSTNRSLMSGASAGGISATSARSLARKNRDRAQSALGIHDLGLERPETPFTSISYHNSHASDAVRPKSQADFIDDQMGNVGGLASPTPKKRTFFRKLVETAKTGVAKTGVANGRSSVIMGSMSGTGSMQSLQASPIPHATPHGLGLVSSAAFSSPAIFSKDAVRDMGLSASTDWVQIRRDVNRSNTLSRKERNERRDRCLMLDYPALNPVDELYSTIQGDEGIQGEPIRNHTDYQVMNFLNVDKNSRFIKSVPPLTAVALATNYVCRPYRSEVQRLRSIFTWVAEIICWEEGFDGDGKVDTCRIVRQKRACAEEYAVLVLEMCGAVGVQCEVIRGHLKTPGEIPETNMLPRPNHWWNAVVVNGEWRMMDCCLASPSNPKRALYSSVGTGSADFWYFLTRPSELCWTHIPERRGQQHLCPPVAHEVLLNLPCSCPPYFINELEMYDYDTSLTRIEDLEMVHIHFNVPADVEVAAEVETRALSRDADGDLFESGEVVKKRALAQAEWFNGTKRYTVKALIPGDEGHGTLKIYAGKRGLMHSFKDIPHPLAFAIPIIHTGENPPYEFVTRHPTPHAQRHDIYVVQPQCQRLALNNTFVFAIRQHPSSAPELGVSCMAPSSNPGNASPIQFVRPGSAMSMGASSNPSSYSTCSSTRKPAKLAIQTPGGKILRLMRKEDRFGRGTGYGSSARGMGGIDEESSDGGTWETIIKCSESGVWRGLVLADRAAKWCVFAEWLCVG